MDDVRHYEDTLTHIRLLRECRKASFSPFYGYHFRIGNTESVTGKYYETLPPKKDFIWYEEAGRDLQLEPMLNTVMVNMFWNYMNIYHYFHPKNPDPLRKQFEEINDLLRGEYSDDCYFPIKEALQNCEVDWISSGIMRFLVKHRILSAGTLYVGSRLRKYKQQFKIKK